MVNWQVTAATIYCDDIDNEVTIMVYKDGSVRCVGYEKYLKQDRPSKRPLQCGGPECSRVIQYRDRIFAEEIEKTDS